MNRSWKLLGGVASVMVTSVCLVPWASAAVATTSRVSVSTAGSQEGGIGSSSYKPAISQDGRFVAFASYSSNLVPNDTNHAGDVFVRDRWKGRRGG